MLNHLGATISLFSKREASGEGGLITGTNPAAFTTSDPLRLWIIQLGIIIIISQLLSLVLRRLGQPTVAAEVLGGILLGPTAFGRIPGFTENIFPPVSIPYLSLVANIGLCLFLFVVGLEIDTGIVKRNARMSIIVSFAGIGLPFGLGSLLSIPLYHRFIDPSVHFTYFMLFTGVAYSITALPVLCRILTELKLLNSNLGVVVLSAGVGNGIVGWILLALSVALVNAGSESALSALWILLCCVGFTIFLFIPVQIAMHWLARKTGSIENGPTTFYMTVVMILVWASGFFTDSIGVDAIFGTFLAGLVVPRDGGLATSLTEKLDDVISILFLPLFFALSGLNTDLGLLDNGVTWAFTIAITVLSFAGKFGGCMIASRLAGYGWRESGTVGALMSCKGLIEFIVLNVGLQAGILSQRVFSMFILEAITLTCVTMPLVTVIYPPAHRIQASETTPSEDVEKGQLDDKLFVSSEEPGESWRHRFTVVLDKMDHISGAMALTQLLLPPRNTSSHNGSTTTIHMVDKPQKPNVSIEALQLLELSDRTSAMVKKSAADSPTHTDPTLGIFKIFGELNELAVTTSLSVVPRDDFARSVSEHAQRHGSHFVLLPWLPSTALSATTVDTTDVMVAPGTPKGSNDTSPPHSQFVQDVFAQSKADVALFLDTGDRSGQGEPLHIFFPFFGGPDDLLALEFVVQLCLNPKVTATVMRMVKSEGGVVEAGASTSLERPQMGRPDGRDRSGGGLVEGPPVTSTIALPDPVYGQQTTQMRLQSETIDQSVWSKYASPSTCTTNATTPGLRSALSRIQFSEAHTATPVHTAIFHARTLRETSCLLIVAGRSQRLGRDSHHDEMKRLQEAYRSEVGQVDLEGMRKTIGDVGAAMFISMGRSASTVVVLQAAHVVME